MSGTDTQQDTQGQAVLWSRVAVGCLGLLSMFFALSETRVVFWFVLFAWSGLGASFGPVVLCALYSKKMTSQGAVAGMTVGFSVTVAWKISGLSDTVIYELVPAFLLAWLAIMVVSRLTRT